LWSVQNSKNFELEKKLFERRARLHLGALLIYTKAATVMWVL
jgi:hypothetical protein